MEHIPNVFVFDVEIGFLRGPVVKCLTRNPWFEPHRILLGFRGSVLAQDTSELQPSTGETQERHE